MILSKTIKVKISSSNFKHFKLFGYDLKVGCEIEIPVEHLSKGSHTLIHVKCDICKKERDIPYRQYLESSNYDKYCCSQKCAYFKNKLTKLEKYGNENYYDKEKSKQTCLEKYGVEYSLQSSEIKEKGKITCLEKFGTESHNSSNIIKDKKKISYLEKYGVENPSQSKIVKEKKIQTCLKHFGSEYYPQSKECKEKYIQDYIEKYGISPNERNLQFNCYKNKVVNLTNKIKNKLLENWDGCDFYDNEYIKDNFKLDSNDKNYPTIDHKISVYYGFTNNISPEEISKIENLCLTKRSLNSKKHSDCYER